MTITSVFIEQLDGTIVENVIIDHGNEQFTSMPKTEYDRLQAEQSTPIVEVTE